MNGSGYESLKEAVTRDCNDRDHCGCFNPEGCNRKGAQIGKYGEPGFKMCTHKYCDKFKWAIDRAKEYGCDALPNSDKRYGFIASNASA